MPYLIPLLLASLISLPSQGATRLAVAATVAPIADLTERVGGSAIALQRLIPQGTNSHTYEPAPSTARTLSQVDLVIANGLHLELPLLRLAEQVMPDPTQILRLGDRTLPPEQWQFDFSFPRSAGHPNPHLWTNPLLAIRYVELISEALSARDPANQAHFAHNARRLIGQLHALDRDIARCVNSIPPERRKLVTYHDSFAYFAPHYGMEVIAAIQPADFSEPSAREVARIIGQLRTLQIPAVFGSEVFPSSVLQQIARESGARFVDQLRDDAFPGRPGDPAHSYIGMMEANITLITSALGGAPACLAGSGPAS